MLCSPPSSSGNFGGMWEAMGRVADFWATAWLEPFVARKPKVSRDELELRQLQNWSDDGGFEPEVYRRIARGNSD